MIVNIWPLNEAKVEPLKSALNAGIVAIWRHVMRSCYCSFKARLFEVRIKGCSFEKYTTVINHSYRMMTVVL